MQDWPSTTFHPNKTVHVSSQMRWRLCLCFPAAAGSRYLSSDISYFGVGSKNAAFYLGRTVKVVTKPRDSAYVHELCIQGAVGLHALTKLWCATW